MAYYNKMTDAFAKEMVGIWTEMTTSDHKDILILSSEKLHKVALVGMGLKKYVARKILNYQS